MTRAGVLGVVTAAGAAAIVAAPFAAQQQPAGPNVAQIEKVKDNLYMITGGGGNTAAFITANGVVLVDTKLANWGQAILDKVKTVTDKPVTHIINTHTHGDHVGSNEFFPASVEIVAQENTAANMKRMDAFKDPAKAARARRQDLRRQDDGARRQARRSTSTTSAAPTPTATRSSSSATCA